MAKETIYDLLDKFEFIEQEAFNPDTGEIYEEYDLTQTLNNLSMEIDKKIEGIAIWIKNLKAQSEAIEKEKKELEKRKKTKDNKIASLEKYIDGFFRYTQPDYFTGEATFHKFETPKCIISYRKSDSINVTDVNKVPDKYIKPRKITDKDIMKSDIKDYLKKHEGETIDGVEIVHNKNISIK